MSIAIISTLWQMVKDSDAFRAFTLIMLSLIAAGLVLAFNTLSAQSTAIEHKLEQKLDIIEQNTVQRSEMSQIEKRLEAIHADVREIRNASR